MVMEQWRMPGIPGLLCRLHVANTKHKTGRGKEIQNKIGEEERRGPGLRVSWALRVGRSPGPAVSQQSTHTHTHSLQLAPRSYHPHTRCVVEGHFNRFRFYHPFERQVNVVAVAFVSKNRRKSINECFSFWLLQTNRRGEQQRARESWSERAEHEAKITGLQTISTNHQPGPPTAYSATRFLSFYPPTHFRHPFSSPSTCLALAVVSMDGQKEKRSRLVLCSWLLSAT